MNGKVDEAVQPFGSAIVKPLPYKDKINIL
jgi:hypothetical protein